MEKLKALLQLPLYVLRMVAIAVGALLRLLLGDIRWQAPDWLLRTRDYLEAGMEGIRRRPGRSALAVLVVLALGGGAWWGWQWWKNLPRPAEVAFSVVAPERTCYECETDNAPKPLRVVFEASVAPLEASGKDLDPAKGLATLAPAIKGTWHWIDDRTLSFQPAEDWPIGSSIDVRFSRQGLHSDAVRLDDYKFRFETPRFLAAIHSSEFYQDPVNAADKKYVVALRFTNPVDTESLEERIQLSLYKKVTNSREEKLDPPAFTVTYDKLRLNAYVHSAALQVDSKAGRAELVVAEGVQPDRPGNPTEEQLKASVVVPGLYSLTVRDIRLQVVRDEQDAPGQALMMTTAHSVMENEIVSRVRAWLLPTRHPDEGRQSEWERNNKGTDYRWFSAGHVTPEVLKAAIPLKLDYVPNERDHVEQHAFRYSAVPGRYIYVSIDKELRSFGGYLMESSVEDVLRVPDYPKELRIAQQGTLLALSGQRKLSLFTRDMRGVRVELGRLLPNQLQHLVTQADDIFGRTSFKGWSFNEANLTERYTQTIELPVLAPGEPNYEVLDIDRYLRQPGASRYGIFFLKVTAWDPAGDESATGGELVSGAGDPSEHQYGRVRDARLLVVTDLGMLVKRNAAGEHDVFIQSIHTGLPVEGVVVEVLGRNGEPVVSRVTAADGHVRFPNLDSFRYEREPVLYLARFGGDMSFMPMQGHDRSLDLSRFDVGGVRSVADPSRLTAYLFSDRGIYRPGDEIRGAAIIKAQDWRHLPAGLPLRIEVVDPRGVVVKRDSLKLSAGGLEEFRYQTREASPTGSYTVSLYTVRPGDVRDLAGSTVVNVQEFQPDRLKMSARFSAARAEGWVKPEDLKAQVNLQNLFGTPAQGRRVTAMLTLSPAIPRFSRWPDYQFRDPQAAKDGFRESLADQKTGPEGDATFDLNLQRYAKATYRLGLVAQGFEADGGRGVTAEAAQLVSSLPFLVGWKADGDLGFVSHGAVRSVRMIAIDADTAKTAAKGLYLQRIERKYVSVLIRQDNGTYKYESRLKEVKLEEKPFEIAAEGVALSLDSSAPGNFSYVVADGAGQVFARVDYSVAGKANLTRSLEKNAELQIMLERADYKPGEEISMQINAPYAGAGLITIERDRVFAWKWFRTTTTASVQTIRLPEDVEGNAYVSVSFVRDPGSAEIFMSPMSYGVQPFSVALDARRTQISLDAPSTVKPGDTVKVKYSATKPSRIVLFAVDEGILQVARYRTPDPLGHFFQKRALQVGTRQILDLLLPEFRSAMFSAPGGDAEGAVGRHLNPFRRRTDKPVAWWSGIVEAGPAEQEISYTVPDYFNGSMRVMAVAVNDGSLGVAERKVTVRGDFVLSPNAPLTVTPGDEFDVSVGVANNVQGSGADAKVVVSIEPSSHFEIVGQARQEVGIGEMSESSARFRVRARDEPGSAALSFVAEAAGKSARIGATVSVRPASPYMTRLIAGSWRGSVDVDVRRDMYPHFRRLQAGVSLLPLGLAHGLAAYLDNYPYSCTEQLVSMAVPGLVLAQRPEFGDLRAADGATLPGLIDELRRRQNSDGAYRYWPGGSKVEEYPSLYAQHVLLEAGERGMALPQDMVQSGNHFLRTVARRDGMSLAEERNTAYAIYLLARQGVLVANEAAALQRRLDERYVKEWRQDATAAWLAGAYQLMKQDALAGRAIEKVAAGAGSRLDRWYGSMVVDATALYVVSRHFPARLDALDDALLDRLVKGIGTGQYQSLAAATTILALDAYASAAAPVAAGNLAVSAVGTDKSVRALPLPAGLFPRLDYPAQATTLRFTNESSLQAYYLVNQSGFDRSLPAEPIRQGLEVIREYTDGDGKPLAEVKMGDEIVVHVKYRTIDRDSVDDAVLVDLLPGGFEPVLPRQAESRGGYDSAGTGDYDEQSEEDYAFRDEGHEGYALNGADGCACGLLWSWSPGGVSHVDTREDRVVAYARATRDLQEFTYRIKATNAGSFVVPPAYAESMYEPQVRARSTAGRVQVTRPR